MFQYMESMIEDLTKRLKQHREDRGITQKELSKMSGVSYSTLTKLESGVIKNPSVEAIIKITKALDLNVDDLIND